MEAFFEVSPIDVLNAFNSESIIDNEINSIDANINSLIEKNASILNNQFQFSKKVSQTLEKTEKIDPVNYPPTAFDNLKSARRYQYKLQLKARMKESLNSIFSDLEQTKNFARARFNIIQYKKYKSSEAISNSDDFLIPQEEEAIYHKMKLISQLFFISNPQITTTESYVDAAALMAELNNVKTDDHGKYICPLNLTISDAENSTEPVSFLYPKVFQFISSENSKFYDNTDPLYAFLSYSENVVSLLNYIDLFFSTKPLTDRNLFYPFIQLRADCANDFINNFHTQFSQKESFNRYNFEEFVEVSKKINLIWDGKVDIIQNISVKYYENHIFEEINGKIDIKQAESSIPKELIPSFTQYLAESSNFFTQIKEYSSSVPESMASKLSKLQFYYQMPCFESSKKSIETIFMQGISAILRIEIRNKLTSYVKDENDKDKLLNLVKTIENQYYKPYRVNKTNEEYCLCVAENFLKICPFSGTDRKEWKEGKQFLIQIEKEYIKPFYILEEKKKMKLKLAEYNERYDAIFNITQEEIASLL